MTEINAQEVELIVVSEDIDLNNFEAEVKRIEDEHLPALKAVGRPSIWPGELTAEQQRDRLLAMAESSTGGPAAAMVGSGKMKLFYLKVGEVKDMEVT